MDNNDAFEAQLSFRSFREIVRGKTKRLVVFCGSGASRSAGLPTWAEFVARLEQFSRDVAQSDVNRSLVEATIAKNTAATSLWAKVGNLRAILGHQYENAVRAALSPTMPTLPAFYEGVWDLNPAALLTLNLDGFVNASYARQKTGVSPRHYLGRQVGGSRDIFLGDRPLIVELHGTIEEPGSWVLTSSDYADLRDNEAYRLFLQTVFFTNTVLFYGVDFTDPAIADQLSFLDKIDLSATDLYSLQKRPSGTGVFRDEFETNIKPIWMPDELGWDEGFSEFIQRMSVELREGTYPPVAGTHTTASVGELPSPAQMMTLTPDDARLLLSSATERYFVNGEFEYDTYAQFCKDYDLAINHATRVRIDTENNTWLGHRLLLELGAGNFGRVYLADNGDGHAAIKIAHDSVRDSEPMLNSFRRGVHSMRLLSEASTAGVVKLLSASELPPSIIMEHVDGIDFERYVADRSILNFSTVARIIGWVAEILFHCHGLPQVVLHRDLRPSNIMLRGYDHVSVSKDDVCVLDFDLSWFKGATGSDYYMSPRAALGYLAPEQLDMASKISARSALVDVYGCGMLFYFGISGDHPVANASTRYDWKEQVERIAARTRSADWHSLPSLVASLILDSTKEAQSERISMQSFLERVDYIVAASAGSYLSPGQYVLIELLHRMYPSSAITADLNSATITSSGATELKAIYDDRSNTFTFRLGYIEKGSKNRSGLGKYLSDAYLRAKDAAGKFSTVDTRASRVQQGALSLVFSTGVPNDIATLKKLADNIAMVVDATKVGDF
ncbi:MAG: hypothetical protein EOP24_24490 [Hyphomicrobiales bacterium]|nr:MAG: hypothetical protein EOP24_24490 [Hyphomicrobiales bacterium]